MSTLAHRLRRLAARTALDNIGDELRAIADELDGEAAQECVFHAVPLTPGDASGPQSAACVTCGQATATANACHVVKK